MQAAQQSIHLKSFPLLFISPLLSLPPLHVAPETGYGAPACSSANSVIVLIVFWLTPFFPTQSDKVAD